MRPYLLAALAAAALAANPASARTELGLGADWLVDPEQGEFQLTLAADTRLARGVTVGARFGGMYLPEPDRVGAPIDLRLRVRSGRVYGEGLVGPWIVFDDDDSLRFHAAFGFGVIGRSLTFGFEVGWLDPTATFGVRLGLPF